MALRPIDNALPIPAEKPKKQFKVSVPIQKQADRTVNDENKVPLPLSGDASIDYISSEKLEPLSDPEVKIQVSPLFLFLFLFFGIKFLLLLLSFSFAKTSGSD